MADFFQAVGDFLSGGNQGNGSGNPRGGGNPNPSLPPGLSGANPGQGGGPPPGRGVLCADSISCLKGGNQNSNSNGGKSGENGNNGNHGNGNNGNNGNSAENGANSYRGVTMEEWNAMSDAQRQSIVEGGSQGGGSVSQGGGSHGSGSSSQWGLNIPDVDAGHNTGADVRNVGNGINGQSFAPYAPPAGQNSAAGSEGSQTGGISNTGPSNVVGPGWSPSPGGSNALGGGRVAGMTNWNVDSIASPGSVVSRSLGREAEGSQEPGRAIPPVQRTATAMDAENFANAVRSGQTFLGIGDSRGALRQAERALELRPDKSEGYELKYEALKGLGLYEEAAKVAAQLAKIDPGANAHKKAALAYLLAGRGRDALWEAGVAVQLGGGAHALVLRAKAYDALGDRQRMLEDLREAVKQESGYAFLLEKALRGERIFDPKDADNSMLLDGMRPRQRGRPWLGFFMLLGLLAGLISAAVGAWRMFSPSARRARRSRELNESMLGAKGATAAPILLDDPAWKEGLLAGKYALLRVLGRGASGQVWEAKDLGLERKVAIKRVFSGDAAATGSRAELLARARTIASIHHPGIADIHEILEHQTGVYLVYQYLEGETLKQVLSRKRRLPYREALLALKGACAALAYAHSRGVFHGDLRTSNIMISPRGGATLLDFSLARSQPGLGAGDVHQLGALLYEALCGEPPFAAAGPTPAAARSFEPASRRIAAPPGLDEVLSACLSAIPGERPRNAQELLSRLEALPEPASIP